MCSVDLDVGLRVEGKRLAPADSGAAEVNTECSFTHETLEVLKLIWNKSDTNSCRDARSVTS